MSELVCDAHDPIASCNNHGFCRSQVCVCDFGYSEFLKCIDPLETVFASVVTLQIVLGICFLTLFTIAIWKAIAMRNTATYTQLATMYAVVVGGALGTVYCLDVMAGYIFSVHAAFILAITSVSAAEMAAALVCRTLLLVQAKFDPGTKTLLKFVDVMMISLLLATVVPIAAIFLKPGIAAMLMSGVVVVFCLVLVAGLSVGIRALQFAMTQATQRQATANGNTAYARATAQLTAFVRGSQALAVSVAISSATIMLVRPTGNQGRLIIEAVIRTQVIFAMAAALWMVARRTGQHRRARGTGGTSVITAAQSNLESAKEAHKWADAPKRRPASGARQVAPVLPVPASPALHAQGSTPTQLTGPRTLTHGPPGSTPAPAPSLSPATRSFGRALPEAVKHAHTHTQGSGAQGSGRTHGHGHASMLPHASSDPDMESAAEPRRHSMSDSQQAHEDEGEDRDQTQASSPAGQAVNSTLAAAATWGLAPGSEVAHAHTHTHTHTHRAAHSYVTGPSSPSDVSHVLAEWDQP